MKWISVKDKIPEWGRRVLIFDGEIKTGYFIQSRRKVGWVCELDMWGTGYDYDSEESIPSYWASFPSNPDICITCSGKGYLGSSFYPRPCSVCGGTGKIE